MNKVNDYENLLELANKDLKQYNAELHVYDPGESGEYTIEIRTLNENGSVACSEDYDEGYYEEDLSDIINEAWAHAKKSAIQIKRALEIRAREEIKKKYSLSDEAHNIAESIQEITLNAWPIIYGPHNKYDQDSRDVLETIRKWGEEFEQWWMSHDESWRCETHDYLEEIDKFTDKKCQEYLKELGVEPGAIEIVDEQTGKVIASKPEDEVRGHMEETIDVMLDIADYAEERFATDVRDRDVERTLNKEWAREFSKWWYCELTDDERMEKDYYAELLSFLDKKFDELKKENEPKEYIVHITRVEKYEADVLVPATSEEEAEKKVEEAWGDGKHDWLYEKMTENINCDSQTYKARQVHSIEEHYDFAL